MDYKKPYLVLGEDYLRNVKANIGLYEMLCKLIKGIGALSHSPRINALKAMAQEIENDSDELIVSLGAKEDDILYGDIYDIEEALLCQMKSKMLLPERAGYTSRYDRACKACPGCCECDEDCEFSYKCPEVMAQEKSSADKRPVTSVELVIEITASIPEDELKGFILFAEDMKKELADMLDSAAE